MTGLVFFILTLLKKSLWVSDMRIVTDVLMVVYMLFTSCDILKQVIVFLHDDSIL